MKLAVIYPWSLEFIATRFADTALNLKHPPGVDVRWFRGRGWCAARRHNHCLEQAIAWGADLVCFVGADQSYYTEDMLTRLVERHQQTGGAITALVPTRGYVGGQGTKPFQPIIWRFNEDEKGNTIAPKTPHDVHIISKADGDFVRADGSGTGVLLFPVTALMHLQPPWFTEQTAGPSFERTSCADWPFVNRLQREADLDLYCDTTILVKHCQMFEIDESFQERFSDWEQDGVGDKSTCEYRTGARLDGPINQVRVSPSLPFYDAKFRKRYGLRAYERVDQPAFFFGCYTKDDYEAIKAHRSTSIIIWAGSDALAMRKAIEPTGKVPFGPNVKHIAISSFIADDLKAVGLAYKSLPLCCVDESLFKPTPRAGNRGIYCYLPKHDREKYGGSFIDRLMPLLPEFDWIINDGMNYKPEDMPAVYEKCFVGVRPTLHDGLSNSCIELGLMGRRVLWNGESPNAIGWTTPEQAAAVIRSEFTMADDAELMAGLVSEHIHIGHAWKDVAYYATAPTMKFLPDDADTKDYNYRDYFDFRYAQGERGAGGPDPDGEEAEWTRKRILSILDNDECESVVEVGCGSMVRWPELPRKHYIGIDVSTKAIEHAREKFPGYRFVADDVTKDGNEHLVHADAVICIDMLQHIKPEDLPKVMWRMYDAAKKVLIVKTSIGIPNLYYQFNHEHTKIDIAPDAFVHVPGSPVSRFLVYRKIASGGREGFCQTAAVAHPAPPFMSEVSQ